MARNPATMTDEEIAAELGLTAPQLDTSEIEAPMGSAWNRALQGFSGLEDAPMSAPRTFAEGAVAGFGRGLGAAGTRAQRTQLRLEEAAQQRRVKRDQENLEATRRYRESLARGRGELAAQARNEPLETIQGPNGPQFVRRSEAVGKAPPTPNQPRAEKERIVAIEGPDGRPVYVKESQALGKQPARTQASEKPRVPSSAERGELVGDIDMLSQVNNIRDAYKPGLVGPATGPIGSVRQRVGLGAKGDTKLRARLAGLRNQILKLRSGGAVTEGEAARLLEELPTMENPSQNFVEKLDQFENTYRNIATARRDVFSGTGVDLTKIPTLPQSKQRPPLQSFWKD